jgi:hypothetical protein
LVRPGGRFADTTAFSSASICWVGETGVTVTSKVAVAIPPSASVAVQVTVVVPTGKVEYDAGVHENDDTVVPGAGDANAT